MTTDIKVGVLPWGQRTDWASLQMRNVTIWTAASEEGSAYADTVAQYAKTAGAALAGVGPEGAGRREAALPWRSIASSTGFKCSQ